MAGGEGERGGIKEAERKRNGRCHGTANPTVFNGPDSGDKQSFRNMLVTVTVHGCFGEGG